MKIKNLPLVFIAMVGWSCSVDQGLNSTFEEEEVILSELDTYIIANFTEEYNMAIRYKFDDNYVTPGDRVAPVRLDLVRPMLNFIQKFWIGPYLQIDNGESFFREHVPPEIVFLGGLIYNSNGTVTLGTADAGARITFTNVNAIDTTDQDWVNLQLQTVYHEFAHTVHQLYKLPNSFETISPRGYTSPGSWFNVTDNEAIARGFVSPYGTSSPNEDFAETVAFYLFDPEFFTKFINKEDCTTEACLERNQGRDLIEVKLTAIIDHYEKQTGVSLTALRNEIQELL